MSRSRSHAYATVVALHGAAVALACASAACLSACAGPTPHRVQLDTPSAMAPGGVASRPIACNPDLEAVGTVDPNCAQLSHEHATRCTSHDKVVGRRGYDLFFVEVDDQGALYPRGGAFGGAYGQLEQFVEALRAALAEKRRQQERFSVSLVAYVHGWKHDADTGDDNVEKFRSLLCEISEIEGQQEGRQVIGLYVGWDGKHLALDSSNSLLDVTFWDRENTADRVAQGAIRELFSRIRTIQAEANRVWEDDVRDQILSSLRTGVAPAAPGKPPMRFLLIGHSFGGRVVFEALSNAMIRNIVDLQHADELLCQFFPGLEPGCAPERVPIKQRAIEDSLAAEIIAAGFAREADLIVLVNPALEATRFKALIDTAHGLVEDPKGFPYAYYRAPHLVVVASETDAAVGIAFPAGRTLGTLFERYVDAEEGNANRTGVGHYLPQVTQRVWPINQSCPGQLPFVDPPACRGWKEPTQKLQAEAAQFAAFKRRICNGALSCAAPDGARAYPRLFCGAPALVLAPDSDASCTEVKDFNANSPIWIVRADRDVIDGHGDLDNLQLHAFVRQLYLDSLEFKAEK